MNPTPGMLTALLVTMIGGLIIGWFLPGYWANRVVPPPIPAAVFVGTAGKTAVYLYEWTDPKTGQRILVGVGHGIALLALDAPNRAAIEPHTIAPQ